MVVIADVFTWQFERPARVDAHSPNGTLCPNLVMIVIADVWLDGPLVAHLSNDSLCLCPTTVVLADMFTWQFDLEGHSYCTFVKWLITLTMTAVVVLSVVFTWPLANRGCWDFFIVAGAFLWWINNLYLRAGWIHFMRHTSIQLWLLSTSGFRIVITHQADPSGTTGEYATRALFTVCFPGCRNWCLSCNSAAIDMWLLFLSTYQVIHRSTDVGILCGVDM